MPKFEYAAVDSLGKVYKGILDAEDEEALYRRFKESGFYVTSINKKREPLFGIRFERVKLDDLVVFSQQFASMINAGLSIVRCLESLEKQTENMDLKRVIREVRLDIESGYSLSEALSKHPKVFSDFFISLIKAGEKSGGIAKVLQRISVHLEGQQDLIRAVRSAFTYPIIVGTLAFLVTAFLVIVIVPVFEDIYLRIKITLPAPTRALVAISNIARNLWWGVVLFVIGIIIFYHRMSNKPKVKKYIDHLKMKMPIFGKLIRKSSVSRFIRTFGDMIVSGISVLDAIEVADRVANNNDISDLVNKMKDRIRRGERITEALKQQDIFPPMVVQMMASGEESATLPYMLQKSADALDRDVNITVKRLIVKLEPLMTVALAALVGFIAIAIYMPIFDLIKQMSTK